MRKLYHSSLVMSLFPFHMIPAGVDIIICGGGIIGKQYVEQVTKSKLYKLLFVADMKWKSFDIAGSRLCSPEEIRGKDAYIVLAIKSKAEAGKMREMLLGMGVKAERIVWNIVECSMVGHCKKLENKWDYFYKDLGELTPRQRRYFEELHRLLRIGRVKDIGFTRVGAEHDGGYIMLDDFADHGVAYSFGIGWNTDWDHDMATRGYQVYMYDHTINPPKLKRSELHFFKEGLGNPDENAQLNTLPHFMKENGHSSKSSMILKMDIERGEWEFLRNIDMDVLKQFDQIVMEVHGIVEERRRDEMLLGFMRILQTHAVVHIHPNNYGKFIWIGDKPFGETLEITFANREKYHVTNAEDVTLPINLDTTCEPAYRDVFMGKWNTPLKKPVEVPKTKLKPATSVNVNIHNNPNQHWGGYTYAQSGDDLLILNLFRNLGMSKFSYIDVGAHHPYNISNTALLYERGCRGVNIEANPNLIEEFRKVRPEDINLNFGIAKEAGELPFYMFAEGSGRNTFDKNTADAFLIAEPFRKIEKVIKIPVRTLASVIEEYCNGVWPDFMSLDIEGLDYEVLSTLNLKVQGPKIIDVEEKGERVVNLMKENGYEFCLNTGNAIYIRNELKDKAMYGK